ncbi:transglycosylase domain-containing protein [Terriglobus tenax]|uniref:transglycosylase domain-containing protein n=1 Tax=Terriglobus tenax TaxID=1111115 RepID=UPI0021DFD280|nr:transglycosylase domain-containing protein [Terriglobus tenax]
MKTILSTALLILLIPCVLLAGLWVWAYYSTPAVVTEAYNRELSRSAPKMRLLQLPEAELAQIRNARPLPEAVAEALFFYPGPYKPNAFRDLQRRVFASALDHRLSSDEQLQIYLNHADFGPLHTGPTPDKDIIGFAAASEAYFDKPLPNLAPEQLQALLDSLQHKSIQSVP